MMSKTNVKSVKNTKLTIRKKRTFSQEFKHQKVARPVAGEITIAQFCQLWAISTTTVYNWLYCFSPQPEKGTTVVIPKDSEATKTKQFTEHVAQPERVLG